MSKIIQLKPEEHEISIFLKDRAVLIGAAVHEGSRALEDWQRWLEINDFEKDNLDMITHTLLPLVYSNLASQGLDHPLMNRMKGIYRRAWVENQLSLQLITPFISQFNQNGIPVLVLDDLTSILSLYDGQGVRRIYSLDILVRLEDIQRVIDFLTSQKIWPKISNAGRYLMVETPLEIWPPFDLPCTIAWRITPYIKTREQAEEAWQHADKTILGDCPVFTVDLESHFLRLCIRAIGSRSVTAFFSLIDIARILRTQIDRIDWERATELARLYHQAFPAVQCLQEITTSLEIPKAGEILEQFRSLPISWTDRIESRLFYHYPPETGLFSRISRRFLLYRRSPKVPGLLGFFRYFQYAWGGDRLRSLPVLATQHFMDIIIKGGD